MNIELSAIFAGLALGFCYLWIRQGKVTTSVQVEFTNYKYEIQKDLSEIRTMREDRANMVRVLQGIIIIYGELGSTDRSDAPPTRCLKVPRLLYPLTCGIRDLSTWYPVNLISIQENSKGEIELLVKDNISPRIAVQEAPK